jgi:hypothetical protein
MRTYGLTSILFASFPGWSGITTNHSNFSAAVEEAIVLILVLVLVNFDNVETDCGFNKREERVWRDMTREDKETGRMR